MDSGASQIKPSASAQTSAISTPSVPQDIIDDILYHIVPDPDLRISLRSCSLVSKSWVIQSQRHLFHTMFFTGRNMFKWVKTFPEPEESPAHYYVRDLCLSLGGQHDAPDEFFKRVRWFTNVKKITVLGKETYRSSLGIHSAGRYQWPIPINTTVTATILQIRDVIAQLQNLNYLAISGSLGAVDRHSLQGVGMVFNGKFGGQSRLLKMPVDDLKDVTNMLLEVPTGLYFTEVEIHCVGECLPSAVSLTKACDKTLMKLSYTVDRHDGYNPLNYSFDFRRSPNLKEVKFTVDWTAGSLLWIVKALSTLNPATSPRLSTVRLSFRGRSKFTIPKDMWGKLCDDMRQVEGEVNRIERDFVGAVNLIVTRPPRFAT